jgi:membrane-bound lytic murein transglycosylase D
VWPQWGVGNRQRVLWTCLSTFIVLVLAGHRGVQTHEASVTPFPVPEVLRPNIAFWTRVFTALDINSGVLHDADDVTIIYHTLTSLPLSARERQRVVERHRRHYQRILQALAQNQGQPRNQEEERVLALFRRKRTASVLRTAAQNIRFQQGLLERFTRGLTLSGAYLPTLQQIFADAGLPTELALLPHIESSFDNRAYSWAGAAGIWQFIPSTGRLFLTIDEVLDERLDIHRASIAAAKLLRQNYQELGTWPLAITAYNHGAQGMKRAVTTLHTKDFGTIVQRYRGPSFGFASKNFYAEFLAVLAILKDHTIHFKDLTFDAPLVYHTLELDAHVTLPTLEKYLELDRDEIVRWNPALRPMVLQAQRRLPKGYVLKIPHTHANAEEIQARWAGIPSHLKFAEQIRAVQYRVRRGDTLSTIARRFGTTTSVLADLNNLRRPHRLRVGQILRLPHTVKESKRYRVQPGDTLSTIAQRFGTTVSALAGLNDIERPYTIRPGQVLQLPPSSSQNIG